MSENQRNESNPPEVGVAVDVVNDTDAKSSESSEAIAVESKPLPTVNQCDENQTDRSEILSRRKQKKLLKLAKWEETKKLKRQKEREKQKQRRAKEVALGIPGPSSKRKKLKLNKIEDSQNLVSVAIDFDYDDLMHDKDIAKCAKQMLWVYTENRKSEMPIRLHFTSIKENSRIEKALDRNDGYKNWDVKIRREPYYDLFDRNSIVYLSADSDNVLTELEPNAVYIIGGLVDHNHHKGLSFQRAQEQGLRTARLPLSEHIEMKTRVALTIVHGKFPASFVFMVNLISNLKETGDFVFQYFKFY